MVSIYLPFSLTIVHGIILCLIVSGMRRMCAEQHTRTHRQTHRYGTDGLADFPIVQRTCIRALDTFTTLCGCMCLCDKPLWGSRSTAGTIQMNRDRFHETRKH